MKKANIKSPVAMKTLELNLSGKDQILEGDGSTAKGRVPVKGAQSVGRRVSEISTAKKIQSNKTSLLKGQEDSRGKKKEMEDPEGMLISRVF